MDGDTGPLQKGENYADSTKVLLAERAERDRLGAMEVLGMCKHEASGGCRKAVKGLLKNLSSAS